MYSVPSIYIFGKQNKLEIKTNKNNCAQNYVNYSKIDFNRANNKSLHFAPIFIVIQTVYVKNK